MQNNLSDRCSIQRLFLMISGVLLMACGSAFAQAPPPNDECDDATVIDPTAPFPPYSNSVDATNATLNPSDPLLSCNAAGDNDGTQTVWYSYTPLASGLVDINTQGSTRADGGELDTAHGVYTGSCGALVPVECVDVFLNDNLNFEVDAGTTYYVKVGQFLGGSDAGTVVVNVEEGVPPRVPETLVIESRTNGTSAPLREVVGKMAADPLAATRAAKKLDAAREIPNFMNPDVPVSRSAAGPVGSQVHGKGRVEWKGAAKFMQIFEGGDNSDNGLVLGTLIAPPDTVGDVGNNYYVQMFNLLTEVFDKEGNSVLGPFPTSAFFNAIPDSWCAYDNDGDPIVLYDEETDRWLVSQFLATNQDGLCIAISTSGDPTGSYNAYEFDFTGIGFPDYPKFGFATGAINVMVNLFNPFQGAALGAIDKSEMLAGEQASMVLFTGGEAVELLFGWVPGDNDGPVFDNTPPTFFANLFDSILVLEIAPDWDDPGSSELALTGIVPVTPWDSELCDAIRGRCIEQPGSGTTAGGNPEFPDFANYIEFLEGITDRMMHRGQTRDFGDRKSAILSHTVDADGSGKAGVRWYELANDGDDGWVLKNENTYSPDGSNRWMGSIAMTASGNTCLGYSISSNRVRPTIGVTGRKGSSDFMNVKETVPFGGVNVQRGVARWGDYSAMSIDPVDDTCWYTQEYAKPNIFFGEYFGWGTKVIQYDVNDPVPAPRSR